MIDYFSFTLGVIGIILLPGPNSMFVLSTSMKHGVKNAYQAAAGVFVGDSILMAISVFGAGTFLKQFPSFFVGLKIAGAMYLFYIGAKMILDTVGPYLKAINSNRDMLTPTDFDRSDSVQLDSTTNSAINSTTHSNIDSDRSIQSPTKTSFFVKALMICLINPKAILFFSVYFVQFIDINTPNPWWSLLSLALICQVASMTYLSTIILLGDRLTQSAKKNKMLQQGGMMVLGLFFIGFAVKLAMASI